MNTPSPPPSQPLLTVLRELILQGRQQVLCAEDMVQVPCWEVGCSSSKAALEGINRLPSRVLAQAFDQLGRRP